MYILGRDKAALDQANAEQDPDPFGGDDNDVNLPIFPRYQNGSPIFQGYSVQTSKHSFSCCQSVKQFKSELNVEKRFFDSLVIKCPGLKRCLVVLVEVAPH